MVFNFIIFLCIIFIQGGKVENKKYYYSYETTNDNHTNMFIYILAAIICLIVVLDNYIKHNSKETAAVIEELSSYLTEEELTYLEEHNGNVDSKFLLKVIDRIKNEEKNLNEIDSTKEYVLIKKRK